MGCADPEDRRAARIDAVFVRSRNERAQAGHPGLPVVGLYTVFRGSRRWTVGESGGQ